MLVPSCFALTCALRFFESYHKKVFIKNSKNLNLSSLLVVCLGEPVKNWSVISFKISSWPTVVLNVFLKLLGLRTKQKIKQYVQSFVLI